MSGVKIVAVLVRCAESLLLCDTIDTERLRFGDIDDCVTQLPVLIREAQVAAEEHRTVVLGRCRWMLQEPDRRLSDTTAIGTATQVSSPEHQAALGGRQ